MKTFSLYWTKKEGFFEKKVLLLSKAQNPQRILPNFSSFSSTLNAFGCFYFSAELFWVGVGRQTMFFSEWSCLHIKLAQKVADNVCEFEKIFSVSLTTHCTQNLHQTLAQASLSSGALRTSDLGIFAHYETTFADTFGYKYVWSLIYWRATVLLEKGVRVVKWALLVCQVFIDCIKILECSHQFSCCLHIIFLMSIVPVWRRFLS